MSNSNQNYIYCYSFALTPESYYNSSRIDRVTLQLPNNLNLLNNDIKKLNDNILNDMIDSFDKLYINKLPNKPIKTYKSWLDDID